MKSRDPVILDRQFVAKDQIIIKEGEASHNAFLIQSGEVKVYLDKDGHEVELARLGAGQIVGEMAFVFDGPRTASVKAVTDCTLILISRQQFEDKLKESDPTVRAIVQMLSKRIVDANNTVLGKRSDLSDLKSSARIIYENISARLPRNQQRTLQNTVLPHLQAFLASLDNFHDRYSDDPS